MSARSFRMAVLFVLASTAPLAAQEPLPITLPAGARIRVSSTAMPGLLEGILLHNDPQSMTVAFENGTQQTLPLSSLTCVDISVSKKRQTLKGALIGTGIGLALGFAIPVDPNNCGYYSENSCSRSDAVASGTWGGL